MRQKLPIRLPGNIRGDEMTTINDLKIKDEDFADLDIESLSDRPSADGMSAQKLKERFDAGSKKVVKPKYNQLIEILTSQEGADNIGITPIEGVAGYTVQQILMAVKILLDDKQSIEQSNIDVGKKFDTAEAQALVREVTFSESSGAFTITKYDGSKQTIDTAIEKVALNVRLDGQQFVLTLVDGTEQRVDLSAFITQTEVKNSDTITLAIESGVIVARLASGSVTMAHLNPEVTAYIEAKEKSAASSAASASVSEQNALNSANSAEQSYQSAKTCQEQACLCATQAEISRQAAATSESNAKASEQAAKQSETKSATSEANAKESEEKAATSESNAATSEQNAKTSEQAAKESETKAATSEENAKKSEENAERYAAELQGSKEEAAASAASAAESAAKAEAEAKKAADIAGGDFVTDSELQAHLDAENPHNVTAEQTGAAKSDLSNVDNTAFQSKAAEAGLGGDYLDKEVYDPQGKEQDVFQYTDDAVEALQQEVEEALNNALTNVSVNGIVPDENGNITLTAEVLSEALADVFAKYLPLTGGTLSGKLDLKIENLSGYSHVSQNNDGALFGVSDDARTVGREVVVCAAEVVSSVQQSLKYGYYTETSYGRGILYGEHNVKAGTSDLTANSSSLGSSCIYQMYE